MQTQEMSSTKNHYLCPENLQAQFSLNFVEGCSIGQGRKYSILERIQIQGCRYALFVTYENSLGRILRSKSALLD